MPVSAFGRSFQGNLESLAINGSTVAPLHDAVLNLVSNLITPGPDNQVESYAICTFDGYEPETIASWRGPYKNLGNDTVVSPTTIPTFECTGTMITEQVQGYIITDPTTATLLIMTNFDLAISPTPGMQFQITPEVNISGKDNPCTC